jgi:hypothetical protein
MKQGFEAFKQVLYQPEEERPEPKKKKGAIILPFEKKSENKEEKIDQGYKAYEALGGALSQKEYQEVMRRAATETSAGSKWSSYAHSYARTAGISLSSEAVGIYGILRDTQDKSYSGLSDQKLLAEALRFAGDGSSLTAFIKKFPNIFK